MGIEACFAGHWDVPPLLAQGDEMACREAEQLFPGIVTASVKRPESHDLCSGLDPESAHRLTAQRVVEAVQKARTGQLRPYKPALPMTVTLRMTTVEGAEDAAQRPGVRRIGEYTIEKLVKRQCDVVKWIAGTGLNMPPKGK
jgi:D-amino peptidase